MQIRKTVLIRERTEGDKMGAGSERAGSEFEPMGAAMGVKPQVQRLGLGQPAFQREDESLRQVETGSSDVALCLAQVSGPRKERDERHRVATGMRPEKLPIQFLEARDACHGDWIGARYQAPRPFDTCAATQW